MTTLSNGSDSVSEVRFECVGCRHTYIVPEPMSEAEEFGFTSARGEVCADCTRTCNECDIQFNVNNGYSHAYDDGDYYCHRCTNEHWRSCAHCDEWVDNWNTISYSTICESCTEDNYWYCDYCEQYHDEDYSCRSNRNVHDYSYRPEPIFHATEAEVDNAKIATKFRNNVIRKYRQMTYMGFELEVESEGGNFNAGAELFSDKQDLVYLKEDGSLNHGFEIVSHPMTLDWFMERFPFEYLEELTSLGFEGWSTGTAGLHVHVSRDAFSSISAEAKFVCLIHNNAHLFEALAGRSDSRWAQFDNGNTENLRRKLLQINSADRYSAVNMNNTNTLEVRIFRSSLKPERLQMALQLVDACVAYSNTCKLTDYANAGRFVDWVHENKDRYAVLASYVSHTDGVFTVQEKE